MSSPTSRLYTNATIITMNPSREVILDGALIVTDSRIAAVGTTSTINCMALPENTITVSLKGKIVLPGLINTHAHLAQSLLRGLAEDLPLYSWLCDAVWPLEASYDTTDGYSAARLTIAEMLRSGTTCFLESALTHRTGFANVVKAVGESGIRACLAFISNAKLVKFEEADKDLDITGPRDEEISSTSIGSLLAAHEAYHGSFEGRLQVWAAAGTPRGAPLSSYLRIGEACREHSIGLTMHCAEAPKDLTVYRDCYNLTPAQFCQEAKLTGPKTVLAHMVHLDLSIDLKILEATETTVAHNPNSNCKLASGVARIPEMLDMGVNVSLGTDGAPCGNTYDMFREMHLAGILHKGVNLNAQLVDATTVLEMATINGARALGLESELGSLEVGKKADFVVIDPATLHSAPFDRDQIVNGGVDPMTVVVYSCTGTDVDMVVVDGAVLVEGKKLVKMDEKEVIEGAKRAIGGIRKRSGVRAKNRSGWKFV